MTVEWRQARSATGLLRTFTDAEVIESSDVHVAQRLTALAKESDETVALAVASGRAGVAARIGMPGPAVG